MKDELRRTILATIVCITGSQIATTWLSGFWGFILGCVVGAFLVVLSGMWDEK
jgi:predicted PurR-regulated permease PerM